MPRKTAIQRLTDGVAETALRFDWQADAACRRVDPEIFFPSGEDEARPAKEFCGSCPVRLRCLGFALTAGERFGVWGGLTAKERNRLSAAEREGILKRAAARAA